MDVTPPHFFQPNLLSLSRLFMVSFIGFPSLLNIIDVRIMSGAIELFHLRRKVLGIESNLLKASYV